MSAPRHTVIRISKIRVSLLFLQQKVQNSQRKNNKQADGRVRVVMPVVTFCLAISSLSPNNMLPSAAPVMLKNTHILDNMLLFR